MIGFLRQLTIYFRNNMINKKQSIFNYNHDDIKLELIKISDLHNL